MKKNLTKAQLIQYAKNNSSEKVKFAIKKDGKYAFSGEVLDAYYEFVIIPRFDNHFMNIDKLIEMIEGVVTFDILTFELYRGNVMIDLSICGLNIPKHFMEIPY